MVPWIFDQQLTSSINCSLQINNNFYFTSKVKLRLYYRHNFYDHRVQHYTQSLGSRIMLPGLMVSYIEGMRKIIIYFYALK